MNAILEFVIKVRKTVKSLKVIYNHVFMGNDILTHDPHDLSAHLTIPN